MEINLKDGGWICTTPIVDVEMRQYVYTLLVAAGVTVRGHVKTNPQTEEYPYIFVTPGDELNAGSAIFFKATPRTLTVKLTVQELLNLAAQQISKQLPHESNMV